MPTRTAAVALALVVLAVAPARAADVVEGKDAVFAGRGLVILWAGLRGADEASASIVIRVLPLEGGPASYAADVVDPATQARRVLVAPQPLSAWDEIRVPRAALAGHPRTELHFAGRLEDSLAGRHALTVVFVGVPPTTPELTTEAALSAYFAGALARARHRPAGPPR